MLYEETSGGVRYLLREDGCVDATLRTDDRPQCFWVLLSDGSRRDGFPEPIYTNAETFRARHWPRLRPLAENEQRTDADFKIRTWEWRGDEFVSRLAGDSDYFSLESWAKWQGEYGRKAFTFGLALARRTCPPHLAVRDDGTIYRMSDDEARGPSGNVRSCSLLSRREDGGAALPPGQLERVQAWRARQANGGEALEASPFPELGDPEDSARLQKLRECIDDHGVWPDEETELAGDYEAAIRGMSSRIRELEEKATSKWVPKFWDKIADAFGMVIDTDQGSFPASESELVERAKEAKRERSQLDQAHIRIRELEKKCRSLEETLGDYQSTVASLLSNVKTLASRLRQGGHDVPELEEES